MARYDDRRRLQHMLTHAVEASEMALGRTRTELDADRQLNLSLVRLLEIVGEAATRVSPDFCEHHPEIPWQDIITLLNRLIHGYDSVDFDILWEIVRQDLPQLISQMEQILHDAWPNADG